MNILELAYRQHSKWINLAEKFGAGDYAEDVVQEMYIRLTKYENHPNRVKKDGDIYEGFIYVIIRNITYDLQRAKKEMLSLSDVSLSSLENDQYDTRFDELNKIVQDEIKNWDWYDSQLFKYVYEDGIGLRKLSRDTKISLSSIFNTIKHAKRRIKEAIETQI